MQHRGAARRAVSSSQPSLRMRPDAAASSTAASRGPEPAIQSSAPGMPSPHASSSRSMPLVSMSLPRKRNTTGCWSSARCSALARPRVLARGAQPPPVRKLARAAAGAQPPALVLLAQPGARVDQVRRRHGPADEQRAEPLQQGRPRHLDAPAEQRRAGVDERVVVNRERRRGRWSTSASAAPNPATRCTCTRSQRSASTRRMAREVRTVPARSSAWKSSAAGRDPLRSGGYGRALRTTRTAMPSPTSRASTSGEIHPVTIVTS